MNKEVIDKSILVLNGSKDEQIQLRENTSTTTLTTSSDSKMYAVSGRGVLPSELAKHIINPPTILVNMLESKSLTNNFGACNDGEYKHTDKEQEVHNMFKFDLVINVVVIENVTMLNQDDLLIAAKSNLNYHLEESDKVKTLVTNNRDLERSVRYALANITKYDKNNVFIYSEFMGVLTKLNLTVEEGRIIQNSLMLRKL